MNEQAFSDFKNLAAIIDGATSIDGNRVLLDLGVARALALDTIARAAEDYLRKTPGRYTFYSRHTRRFLNTTPKRRRNSWFNATLAAYKKAIQPLTGADIKDIWNNARPRL